MKIGEIIEYSSDGSVWVCKYVGYKKEYSGKELRLLEFYSNGSWDDFHDDEDKEILMYHISAFGGDIYEIISHGVEQ